MSESLVSLGRFVLFKLMILICICFSFAEGQLEQDLNWKSWIDWGRGVHSDPRVELERSYIFGAKKQEESVCFDGSLVIDSADIRDPRLRVGLYEESGIYRTSVRISQGNSRYNLSWFPGNPLSFGLRVELDDPGEGTYQDFYGSTYEQLPFRNPDDLGVAYRNLAALGFHSFPNRFDALENILGMDGFSDSRSPFPRNHRFKDQSQFSPDSLPILERSYFSGLPFQYGPDLIVRYRFVPVVEENPPLDSLIANDFSLLRTQATEALRSNIFFFSLEVQILDHAAMTYKGNKYPREEWIENAALPWDEKEVPFQKVATLIFEPSLRYRDSNCKLDVNVMKNSLPEHQGVGAFNKAWN